MPENVLSRPTVSGDMRISSLYRYMNMGLTDTILLIGHADAKVMYEPYQVVDVRQALEFLGYNAESPLLLAFLEAYNAGCKDIWLYPAAPMIEYVSSNEDRFEEQFNSGVNTGLAPGLPEYQTVYLANGAYTNQSQGLLNFYEKWFERLHHAYLRLLQWDFPDYVVPVEAVFHDSRGIDFIGQLLTYCKANFETTGSVTLGVLGTRIPQLTDDVINSMVSLSNSTDYGDEGRFVMVVLGEGIVSHKQLSVIYPISLSVQVASLLAVSSLDRSIVGLRMPKVSSLVGKDLTNEQMDALTQARINPVVRTPKGKRGLPFECKLLTDNTMGRKGTDYWSMTQMRIVANIINNIRQISHVHIGETNFDLFRVAVRKYMENLRIKKYINDYSLKIDPSPYKSSATVNIGITPITGIRNIYFNTEVGPGA